MTQTLISFLGKAQKKEGQYRETHYEFENGAVETARFFTRALSNVIKPERLIILGTSASMWDVLCENLGADEHDQWVQLSDAVENDSVTQPLLDQFNAQVSEILNTDCRLKWIPYGDNLAEQVAILQKMAEDITDNDCVSLDLTHGLRHLPMLGLLSAMYLKTARDVIIDGIYYGALDRTKNDRTPVMRLDGLLTMADWISALDGFNKTGNIAPFSELLQRDGMAKETAQCLEEAAFFENTLNIPNARSPLKKFAEATKDGLKGIGALFQDSLRDRIAWHKQDSFYLRQRENAYFYLKQGDYLRAATLGYEAFITYQVQQDKTLPKLDPQNFEHRNQIKQKMEKDENAKLLNHLRNAIAHGTRSDIADAQSALSSQEKLDAELNRLFKTLLPKG